ncbi:hypothetical protein KC343_g3321 [Hortaea werneckii]|nr:hypothetical protein KC323_g3877 [Hortaea werneckii]KAI6875337.1 hypothetical protein KC338_g794 [Hortaea werneckii]KAI7569001.1 hypothetical protein KC317_g3696 [Hortaea werneckii]KAI7622393.1 hypothetical protein KC346_g3234 [Hortaea werneckii]KAI7632759.1 hypothetical protein KC343_g3321 [Hortaea werneckii]
MKLPYHLRYKEYRVTRHASLRLRRPISPIPIHLTRYATTKAKKVPDADDEGNVKGLAELQASLEAVGYGPRKRSRARRQPQAVGDGEADIKARKKRTTKAKDSEDDEQEQPKQRTTRRRTKTGETSPAKKVASTSTASSPKPTRRKRSSSKDEVPPRLLPPTSQKHHDLASFLEYAERTSLNPKSTVYRGTHFEYTTAQTLADYAFKLRRTGRSNDLGIDLVGHWILPASSSTPAGGNQPSEGEAGHAMPVLVQCKASKLTPSMVRELEGAYIGAPAGWRGDGVLAVLVSTMPATKGVSAAVQRSQWPLAVMQIERDGILRQFLWNAKAAEAGLTGLGVTTKYATKAGDDGRQEGVEQSIGLTWMDKAWNTKPSLMHS